MAAGSSNLRAYLVRLAVLAAGLGAMILAAVLHRFAGLGLGLTLTAEYLAVCCVVWGLNAFVFRRLPLSWFSLLLFSAAVFGGLFFVAYFVRGIVAPFLVDSAGRFIGLVRLADLIFYVLALMTVAGAAGCAFSRNIIYSAWSLLFAFLGVAGLYVLLGADFPAMAQVLIYVGGVLVLILFAIMLTKQIGGDPSLTNAHLGLPIGAALAAATIGTLTYMAVMAPWKVVAHPSYEPVSAALGIAFLTDFLLPFEVASVVLLAALVGAVVIARKEIKETSDTVLER
ncbi:MAG TPA: NADH-quinone oxidoreductase subunit J [Myxococcales bacterium]|nr:NADH-quinone oxidoreductase subunit J [Myxococcales bacterium]